MCDENFLNIKKKCVVMEMTMNQLECRETVEIFIRKGLELTLIKLNSQIH